ncbi:MAG: hypothetical protein LLF76_00490 [Planctomycetaceae bacterium]|nr:hypothetical protein [Planctomycetaceae bacterium]
MAVHDWALAGQGTALEPFVVASAADLGKIWLRPWAHYCLACDLDLAGINWSSAVVPVFAGNLDGQGFVISNLHIDQPNVCRVGLLGSVKFGGLITNIGTVNVYIRGYHIAGGPIGENGGAVLQCYSHGTVIGLSELTGGLVGLNDGELTACFSTCSVDGTGDVGGLAGSADGTIERCYATGAITGSGLSPLSSFGGLVGISTQAIIISSYATGHVGGTGYRGGLIGFNDSASVSGCFWNITTSGRTAAVGYGSSTGITGKNTTNMQVLSTFTGAGWDFSDTDGDGADWMMLREGEDYPRLAWQEVYAGDIAGLYGVNMVDLMEIARNWLETGCPADCEQADIDASGVVDLGGLCDTCCGVDEGVN